MYKVFINDKALLLTSDPNFQVKNYQQFSDLKVDILLQKIQSDDCEGIVCLSFDINEAWKQFCSYFTWIEAAGGLVENQQGEFLFIYRLGKWDLPKGKLETNENIKECAVREVEEECQVSGLEIIKELSPTYHVYPYKGSWALKKTHWFKMKTNYSGQLIPQIEEGIEKVEWLGKNNFEKVYSNTYSAIKQVLINA